MAKEMTLKSIKVPKGGLLNPSLRKMKSKGVKGIKPMKVHNAKNFKNVLGK